MDENIQRKKDMIVKTLSCIVDSSRLEIRLSMRETVSSVSVNSSQINS